MKTKTVWDFVRQLRKKADELDRYRQATQSTKEEVEWSRTANTYRDIATCLETLVFEEEAS